MENDDEVKDSLFCHRDGNRVCGPDCMAYQTELPSGYQEVWAHCIDLVNRHQTSKHLIAIATLLKKGLTLEEEKNRNAFLQGAVKP